MNGNTLVTATWLAGLFPDLRKIQHLSQGGQKQVFSAFHPSDGDVVLKLMHPPADIERTARELIAVARARSTRVPAILGHGTISTPIGDCFWFREKRILGETVQRRLEQGPLGTADLLKMCLHVTESLVAAEDVNIVHRDVKPANIILDESGDFWLIDFGIARHLGLDSLTDSGNPFGVFTIGYAPPEQCRNIKRKIDARADLFALGVTLFECATGLNPFRDGARDGIEILKRIERDPLPRLRLQFSAAAEFADLVVTLTQKQRVHRPRTVQEVFEWVKDICNEEGVR